MALLFKKTKEIELEINEYLDLVGQSALHLEEGVRLYLNNRLDDFEERLLKLQEVDAKGSELRRTIESKLYIHTLIPESRGDVLGLIESSYKVLKLTEDTLLEFSVEHPKIIPEVVDLFQDLATSSLKAVEYMVKAIRSYFESFGLVKDNINKVIFYEKESDSLSEKIKRIVFKSEDISLSEKFHLRYFALHIESISDEAEEVCDKLSIATIKRHL